jgi:hypothetical protein
MKIINGKLYQSGIVEFKSRSEDGHVLHNVSVEMVAGVLEAGEIFRYSKELDPYRRPTGGT